MFDVCNLTTMMTEFRRKIFMPSAGNNQFASLKIFQQCKVGWRFFEEAKIFKQLYTCSIFPFFNHAAWQRRLTTCKLQATYKLPWVLQRVPFESETLLLLAVGGTEQRERQCFDNLSLPWINNREHNDWNDVQSEGTESCEVSHSLVDLVRGQHTDGGFFNYLPRKWTMLNLPYKMNSQ